MLSHIFITRPHRIHSDVRHAHLGELSRLTRPLSLWRAVDAHTEIHAESFRVASRFGEVLTQSFDAASQFRQRHRTGKPPVTQLGAATQSHIRIPTKPDRNRL